MAKSRQLQPMVNRVLRAGTPEQQGKLLQGLVDNLKLAAARAHTTVSSTKEVETALFTVGQQSKFVSRTRGSETKAELPTTRGARGAKLPTDQREFAEVIAVASAPSPDKAAAAKRRHKTPGVPSHQARAEAQGIPRGSFNRFEKEAGLYDRMGSI